MTANIKIIKKYGGKPFTGFTTWLKVALQVTGSIPTHYKQFCDKHRFNFEKYVPTITKKSVLPP